MEFIAGGRVTFYNVTFVIHADNIQSACVLAMLGEHTTHSINDAETIDWEIMANTVKPNE
jgi:hypothetical protein